MFGGLPGSPPELDIKKATGVALVVTVTDKGVPLLTVTVPVTGTGCVGGFVTVTLTPGSGPAPRQLMRTG